MDDDEQVIHAFMRLFAGSSTVVETAMTSASAEHKARSQRFDTIIVDLNLGYELGTQTISSLAKVQPDAVFILTTGAGEHSIPNSDADSVVTCVLHKPLTPAAVFSAVKRERLELESPAAPNGMTALVVGAPNESERATVELQRIFQGARILRAETLAEVPTASAGCEVDLCLVSPAIKDCRGLEGLHRLRQHLPSSAVVVLANDFDQARVARFLRHGADDVVTLDSLARGDSDRVVQLACERRRARQQLIAGAQVDPLTGLITRQALRPRFDRARDLAARFTTKVGLVFIDLDGFKQVNDTLGHAAGDQLLAEIAGRMKAGLRGVDTLARIGGDEFVLLAERVSSMADLEGVAERLRQAVATPVTLHGQAVTVGASCGLSLFPEDAGDLDALQAIADARMYENKRERKPTAAKRSASPHVTVMA